MIQRSCFTPRVEDNNWLQNNIYQSTCTIKAICRFVIDFGSCENVISENAVQKLGLKTEKHPEPYKLAWLKKGNEVIVS